MLAAEGIVDLAQFALLRNLTAPELAALGDGSAGGWLRLGPPASAGAGLRAAFAVTADRLAALAETVATALTQWHRAQPDMLGPTGPALAAQLRSEAPDAVLDAALLRLAETGRATREGGMWRLADHRPRLAGADEKLWRRIYPLLAEDRLRPPRVREIAAALGLEPDAVERLLRRAARLGRVAKVADNRYFLPKSIERLAEIARELAARSPEGTFTASVFKDRSGIGRNLTISILEYLDKIGVTHRVGDARVVRQGGTVFG
jgi:selenocysteine-specific elongation factor